VSNSLKMWSEVYANSTDSAYRIIACLCGCSELSTVSTSTVRDQRFRSKSLFVCCIKRTSLWYKNSLCEHIQNQDKQK